MRLATYYLFFSNLHRMAIWGLTVSTFHRSRRRERDRMFDFYADLELDLINSTFLPVIRTKPKQALVYIMRSEGDY